MRRAALLLMMVALSLAVRPQYPYARSMQISIGEERPMISAVAQDKQGLIWAASDIGLLRTDGERTDLMLPIGGARISAMVADGDGVLVATSRGEIIYCVGYRSDTVLNAPSLASMSVRSMLRVTDGSLWLGTYGGGVLIMEQESHRIDRQLSGLHDQHINALCSIDPYHMAVATDQGIAVCDRSGRVIRMIDESHNAPDNLVLSLAANGKGGLWAGTDGRGVFHCIPLSGDMHVTLVDTTWALGPVTTLAFGDDHLWAGTMGHGTAMLDVHEGALLYSPNTGDVGFGSRVVDVIAATDGAAWWCDGTDLLYRADPDVLLVPRHEGVDLQHVSALCADAHGDIWFSTHEGVFHHRASFALSAALIRSSIPVDSLHTVQALRATMDGSIWVGTLGKGVYRIAGDGSIQHYAETDGLCNNNVLAIRTRIIGKSEEVWFATLGGLCKYQRGTLAPDDMGRFEHVEIPGSGFLYDLLLMPDGSVLAATDGSGIISIAPDGIARKVLPNGRRTATFYSLCLDAQGSAWACGPMTGLCKLEGGVLHSFVGNRAPFDGEVFAINAYRDHILALGKSGLVTFAPRDSTLLDLSASSVGSVVVDAPLNASCVDANGALWFASDRGLMRLHFNPAALSSVVPAVITSLDWGDDHLSLDSGLTLRYDQNFLTFHFAGLRYAEPGGLRFEYRLIGLDPRIRSTRDREVNWSRLPHGQFRFEVRAAIGNAPASGPWTRFTFAIDAPWWRTPWVVVIGLLLAALIVFALIRSRDQRLRYRDRVEKEKARFQLDALRSQVNPHFLFNSFNTLIELIEEDQDKAVQHVEHLSDFFREILQVRDKELIPLMEELHLVDTYFYLEQRRFGNRIALHSNISLEASVGMVPPLTVQLLVENALKHNRATVAEPLVITIAAEKGTLSVSNPYRPRSETPKSTGFGLNSIQQRFASLGGNPVEVINKDDNFTVRIPLIENTP